MTTITPEKYVMRLGKYNGMKAIDVANIRIMDKHGKEKREGVRYLKWLITRDWFKHTSIIEQIISTVDDTPTEEAEVKPKVQKKKEPKASKNVSIKVKPTDESNVLFFED